ncbi:hypothetical protein DICVIV_09356 [Dictyocaulus viviparus]|uniref:Uncharacterized protein n=1 Tax=Dictyocaulus viviparus TaxID=29172 RepID=A0A0D8XLC9_DICVI|nr:hypothetical protein DICVIV_09356 [Dictyocaulus viviparus]
MVYFGKTVLDYGSLYTLEPKYCCIQLSSPQSPEVALATKRKTHPSVFFDREICFFEKMGSGGKLARSFVLCPFCFNNHPFETMKDGDGCNLCPHATCANSYMTLGVCGCLQECGGVMVLDPNSHPKWRLTCNKCPSVVAMFEGAHKFHVLENLCSLCNAHIVNVEYKDKSPLSNGRPNFRGCMFCDESVKDLVNLHHAFRTECDRFQKTSQRPNMRGQKSNRSSARGTRVRNARF